MLDLIDTFEAYCVTLGLEFSYGTQANRNLLQNDKEIDKIYFLLDPVTEVTVGSEFGGDGEKTFSGSFLLVVQSSLDMVHHNQKGVVKTEGKYLKNIKPLKTILNSFRSKVDCSDLEITNWSAIDVINVLDANMDGLTVQFGLKLIE